MPLSDDMSIQEALEVLVADTDLEEVACCLDMIAHAQGRHVLLTADIVYPVQPDDGLLARQGA